MPIKCNLQSISIEKLSPKEIALDYFRYVLNVIPLDDSIADLESNEKLFEFVKELS